MNVTAEKQRYDQWIKNIENPLKDIFISSSPTLSSNDKDDNDLKV